MQVENCSVSASECTKIVRRPGSKALPDPVAGCMWKGIGIGTVRKGEEGNVKTESRNRESGEKRVIGRKGWKWQEIRVELTPQSFLTVGV